MKTILRIFLILLVAAIVTGGFYLAANNAAIASNSEGERLVMTDANGQTIQPMERPDGDREGGASLAGGLGGVMATLAKIAGITVLVTMIQKALVTFKRRNPSLA
ncbi:MAG: hypothetical protein QM730_28270 [Anaerolineales bacterium]